MSRGPGTTCEDGREFGLQYLFGMVDTAEAGEAGLPRYTQIWAFDRPGEKRAFEELIDFITERRTRHPGLHVYHYNHYEPRLGRPSDRTPRHAAGGGGRADGTFCHA
jgi:predicted RecB family nuclease